ncbi:MAG: hypothetical protein Q7R47_04365 [Candidatus Diapherotrites archaeon]|nr:hypothetical protein [Candidatus Diapherotrites archaeon]
MSAPDRFHSGLESNAKELQSLGFGTCIDYATPTPILTQLITDHCTDNTLRKRMETMARLSDACGGRKRISELANEFGPKKKDEEIAVIWSWSRLWWSWLMADRS